MPRVNFVGLEWCSFCKSNRHSKCDLHINDGAVDALDFILVNCKCPCKGRVYENGRLIDLVGKLQREIDECNSSLSEQTEKNRRLTTLMQRVRNELTEFSLHILDDEGLINELDAPYLEGVVEDIIKLLSDEDWETE